MSFSLSQALRSRPLLRLVRSPGSVPIAQVQHPISFCISRACLQRRPSEVKAGPPHVGDSKLGTYYLPPGFHLFVPREASHMSPSPVLQQALLPRDRQTRCTLRLDVGYLYTLISFALYILHSAQLTMSNHQNFITSAVPSPTQFLSTGKIYTEEKEGKGQTNNEKVYNTL